MKKILTVLLLFIAIKAVAVPEIPEPISDIAVTTMRNGEVVILYNPNICQQLGVLVCNFFRNHEYGHVYRGHLLQGTHPQQAEFEADCWAAKNAPLNQVQAAYQHFMKEGFMGDWSHGSGHQRAQRLVLCAQTRADWERNANYSKTTGNNSTTKVTQSNEPTAQPSNTKVKDARARLGRLSSAIYFVHGKYAEKKELLFTDKDPCEVTFYETEFYPDSSPTFDLKGTVYFGKGIDFDRVPMSSRSVRFINDYLKENSLGSKYHHITKATTFLPETENAYIPEIIISTGPLKYWAIVPHVGEAKVEKASDYGQQAWLSFSSARDRDSYFDLLVELQNACLNKSE